MENNNILINRSDANLPDNKHFQMLLNGPLFLKEGPCIALDTLHRNTLLA